jgi:hypothetical protein
MDVDPVIWRRHGRTVRTMESGPTHGPPMPVADARDAVLFGLVGEMLELDPAQHDLAIDLAVEGYLEAHIELGGRVKG